MLLYETGFSRVYNQKSKKMINAKNSKLENSEPAIIFNEYDNIKTIIYSK